VAGSLLLHGETIRQFEPEPELPGFIRWLCKERPKTSDVDHDEEMASVILFMPELAEYLEHREGLDYSGLDKPLAPYDASMSVIDKSEAETNSTDICFTFQYKNEERQLCKPSVLLQRTWDLVEQDNTAALKCLLECAQSQTTIQTTQPQHSKPEAPKPKPELSSRKGSHIRGLRRPYAGRRKSIHSVLRKSPRPNKVRTCSSKSEDTRSASRRTN
jgi:hypothetical protein